MPWLFGRSEFVVEPVRAEDLRAVMRLSWAQHSPPLPGAFFEQAAQHEPERFRVVRESDKGEVAGFVLTTRLPLRERSLLLLAVRPNLVGKGLRRALLRELFLVLRKQGEREVTIQVPVEADELLDFYRNQGFMLMARTSSRTGDEYVLTAPLPA